VGQENDTEASELAQFAKALANTNRQFLFPSFPSYLSIPRPFGWLIFLFPIFLSAIVLSAIVLSAIVLPAIVLSAIVLPAKACRSWLADEVVELCSDSATIRFRSGAANVVRQTKTIIAIVSGGRGVANSGPQRFVEC
jgi:hypothetical protein